MTTIANLVIAASLDPTGVRTGLDTSLGYLQTYAGLATQALKRATGDAAVQADKTAVTYLDHLNTSFRAGQAALKVNLFSGAMTPAEYEAHATQNAIAYNAALSAGIKKFMANGFSLQDMYPLVNSFKQTGVAAGNAFGAGGLQGLSRIRMGLTSLIAQFTGTIPVLDRVGSQLLLFGTGGNIALAVIGGLTLLAAAWHAATTEAREHTKAVEEGTKALQDWYRTEQQGPAGKLGSDLDAARESLRNLIAQRAALRTASTGAAVGGEAGIVQQRDAAAQLARTKKQYDDLTTQIQAAEDRVSEIMRKAATDRADAQMRDLATIVTAHHATADQLQLTRNLIAAADQDIARLRGSSRPEDMDLLAKAIQTRQQLSDALNPKKDQQEADKAWRDHIATIRGVVDAYGTLASEHVITVDAGRKLLATYEAVNDELARSTDLTSRHSAELLKLRAEMERTDMLAALRGPMPALSETKGGASALAGAPSDAVATASQLVERARLLTEAGQRTTQAYRDTIDALRIVDSYLTAANEHEGITNDRLREQAAIRQTLATQTAPVTQTPFMTDLLSQATRAERMIALAEGARRAGASNAAELEREANEQRDRAVRLIRIVVEQSADWNNLTDDQRKQLEQIIDLLGGITPATDNATKGFAGIATALHGVLDAAAGLGDIPHALRDGVTAAEHLLTSVKAIQAAKASADKAGGSGWDMGNVLGAAGGALGAVGAGVALVQTFVGLFHHHDETLERNTKKLDELRQSMVDTNGIGGLQQALQATQYFQQHQPYGMTVNGEQTLTDALKAAGLTRDQFNKISADLGIEYSTQKLNTFASFQQALELAISAARKFGNTLDDQTSIMALRNKVNNTTAPVDEINSALTLLGQFAPKLREQIGDIDVTSKEGQDELRAILKRWVEVIATNGITPAELGTLGGVKDLAQIIDTLAGGLNSLNDSVKSAAQSINNVEWYRLNQAVYDVAGLAGAGGGPAVNTPSQLPATGPNGPQSTDTRPYLPMSAPQFTIAGDVILQVPETDPETLRRTVFQAFREKSFNTFGTEQRWPELQE